MTAMQETKALTKQVLEKITPTKEDRAKVEAITRELELKVSLACKEAGVSAIVRVEGSVAKDTWLKENPDIDIFMIDDIGFIHGYIHLGIIPYRLCNGFNKKRRKSEFYILPFQEGIFVLFPPADDPGHVGLDDRSDMGRSLNRSYHMTRDQLPDAVHRDYLVFAGNRDGRTCDLVCRGFYGFSSCTDVVQQILFRKPAFSTCTGELFQLL